jgi:2,4-dienoyl-CoA reductase-like NADH-dependent reductase (Old Yellow Enzyme family)/thioredoxin reductase
VAADNPHYPALFSPIEIGGVQLRNRIMHAAIVTQYVRNSAPTEQLLNYYRARAAGGAAALITEPIAMTQYSRLPSRLRCWDDQGLDDLKRVADTVASEGAHILGQIQDSGRGRHSVGRNDDAVGASALPDDLSWTVPSVLSSSQIRQMIDDWATGSHRLQRAGFSGVEISAGHGHLLHQFLSPWSNRREDEYGGDLQGRSRFLLELISAIRSACGSRFIISLKLPGDDGVTGGIDLTLAGEINQLLAATPEFDLWTWVWGAHARSLYRHLPDAHGERHPYLRDIRALREAKPNMPAGAIGYLTDPVECEAALTDGTADVIFLGRPLITDPNFPNKAATGKANEIRYCVSCNSCWRSIIEGGSLQCDNNPRVAEANEHLPLPSIKSKAKHVVVVGSGVAGLEAAHTAAERGHKVTLLGHADSVGGKTRLHAQLPGGENLSSIYDFQLLSAQRSGVDVHSAPEAGAKNILALKPDLVLLATGARTSVPNWLSPAWAETGLIKSLRESAAALLEQPRHADGRVVLVDQDHTEMTYAFAMYLTKLFDQVTLVTSRERIAHDVSLINRQGIHQRLFDLNIELICHVEPSNLERLEEGALVLRNVYNGRETCLEEVAAVIHASSRLPNDDLLNPLRAAGLIVTPIGDCHAPRSLMAATREAYRVAHTI